VTSKHLMKFSMTPTSPPLFDGDWVLWPVFFMDCPKLVELDIDSVHSRHGLCWSLLEH